MSIEIRRFSNDDIDFGLAQTAREGWDNTASIFEVCLAHDPEGCFIAEADGWRAGMITTVRYARSAWVGNLIVEPDCRRQGIGKRLMTHAINRLEARGVRTTRLEADPMGVGLYRRLGFVNQFETPRFRKEPPHAVSGNRASRLERADLDAVKTLDRTCFGDDRGRLLGHLLEVTQAAYCVRANRQVEGFAMVLPSTAGIRLGPCVATRRTAAEELLDSVLADFPNVAVLAGVPSVNRTAVGLLESRGFTRMPSSLRMVRGEAAGESDPEKVVAITNGAMG